MNLQYTRDQQDTRKQQQVRGTAVTYTPHRDEWIIQQGEGCYGFNPIIQNWFEEPIFNDKFNKYHINSRIVVDKFSGAMSLISTLQNIIDLIEKSWATDELQLKILQYVIKENLPEA